MFHKGVKLSAIVVSGMTMYCTTESTHIPRFQTSSLVYVYSRRAINKRCSVMTHPRGSFAFRSDGQNAAPQPYLNLRLKYNKSYFVMGCFDRCPAVYQCYKFSCRPTCQKANDVLVDRNTKLPRSRIPKDDRRRIPGW